MRKFARLLIRLLARIVNKSFFQGVILRFSPDVDCPYSAPFDKTISNDSYKRSSKTKASSLCQSIDNYNLKILKNNIYTIPGLANTCCCCHGLLLRHLKCDRVYWYCQNCHQEMPNLSLANSVSITREKSKSLKPSIFIP